MTYNPCAEDSHLCLKGNEFSFQLRLTLSEIWVSDASRFFKHCSTARLVGPLLLLMGRHLDPAGLSL